MRHDKGELEPKTNRSMRKAEAVLSVIHGLIGRLTAEEVPYDPLERPFIIVEDVMLTRVEPEN